MREPQLLRQIERLADADHAYAQDHIIADFGRLTRTRITAMHNLPAHLFEYRTRFLERLCAPSGHQRQRGCLGAADTAGDWAVERQLAGRGCKLVSPTRRSDVD